MRFVVSVTKHQYLNSPYDNVEHTAAQMDRGISASAGGQQAGVWEGTDSVSLYHQTTCDSTFQGTICITMTSGNCNQKVAIFYK